MSFGQAFTKTFAIVFGHLDVFATIGLVQWLPVIVWLSLNAVVEMQSMNNDTNGANNNNNSTTATMAMLFHNSTNDDKGDDDDDDDDDEARTIAGLVFLLSTIVLLL